jgi:hypothetical protein
MIELEPRCLIHKGNNTFLGPDGYLKPCCFVNNARDWGEFQIWIKDNNLDINDFKMFKRGIDKIKESPAWQLLEKQLESKDPNCPSICKKMCGKTTTSNLHIKLV